MKTYEEILDEVVTDEYKRINPVAINIHRNAAKEYAKMWVKKALEETHETYVIATVEDYLNQIDKQ